LDLRQIKTLCKNLILVFAWSEQFFWLPLEKKNQLCTGVLEVRFECDYAGVYYLRSKAEWNQTERGI
jgi:hypothetical protein